MKFMYANAGVKDEATDKSVKTYAALTLISASCHVILNTSLIKPNPKIGKDGKDIFAWFDDVNSKLDDSKNVARDWINNVVTPIQGEIPSSVITFDNQLQETAQYILNICKQYPKMKKGDDAFNDVNQLLDALKDTIDNDILVPIDKSRTALKSWGESMQKAHDALSGKVKIIQDAEVDLAADIERLNTSIETIHGMISSESTLVAVGAGLVGGGIFVALIGVVLCVSGVGAVAGGIVMGVGAAMVIGGAVTWGVMQGKIDAQYKEIAEDRKEINADKQLLVSLKSIEGGTVSAVENMQIALSALDEVKSMWESFRNIISGTMTDLSKAENAPSSILKRMFTETAVKQWGDAHVLAQKLLDTKVKVEDKGKIGDKIA